MLTEHLLSRLSSDALRKIESTALEHDTAKLEQLAQVVPDEQAQVVQCHLSLGVPWESALEGRTPRSPEETAETNDAAEKTGSSAQHRVQRWPIEKLKPNRFNAALFPDSLSKSSIALIGEDMHRNGQRVPVEIDPDGTILDGERRWRGAQHLGWKEIDVVVGPELSDDEILDRVVDACTSARQMTLREQVNVYAVVCERLKREAGRQQGRPPEKTFQKGNVFLNPRGIRNAAAKRAGFSSPALALRAEAIFSRGSAELQAQLRDGSLTITAAYDELPKRPKKQPASSEDGEPEAPAEGAGARPEVLLDDVVGDEPATTPQAGTPTLPEPACTEEGPLNDENETLKGMESDADSMGADAEMGDTIEGGTDEAAEDTVEQSALLDLAESGSGDVSHHVSALCSHLARLSEHDYDEAAAWYQRVVDELEGALGEPPEFVDEDQDQQDESDEIGELMHV